MEFLGRGRVWTPQGQGPGSPGVSWEKGPGLWTWPHPGQLSCCGQVEAPESPVFVSLPFLAGPWREPAAQCGLING